MTYIHAHTQINRRNTSTHKIHTNTHNAHTNICVIHNTQQRERGTVRKRVRRREEEENSWRYLLFPSFLRRQGVEKRDREKKRRLKRGREG